MLNDRQYAIVELLTKSPTPVRPEEIAKIVLKSKRTIMRDFSTIKLFFDTYEIGELVCTDDHEYTIRIDNETAFMELMKDNINDEQLILYELITQEYVTIEQLADLLYVSKITVSEKLSVVKEEYAGLLNIVVAHRGHSLEEPSVIKCVLLSNLIDTNLNHYLDLSGISSEKYQLLLSRIQNDPLIKEYFPNLSDTQIVHLFIAALLYQANDSVGEENDELLSVYTSCSLQVNQSVIETLVLVSDYCIETNLNLTIDQVQKVLNLMVEEYHLSPFQSELAHQLYHHLKRTLCYPNFLELRETMNISNIKALYPFSFDLGIIFTNAMRRLYQYRIVNSDLISLYFTVSMGELLQRKHSILIDSEVNSIAIINRQLMETTLSNCEVTIGETSDPDQLKQYSLVISNKTLPDTVPVFKTDYILSEKNLVEIQKHLEDISIGYNLKNIFPREYSYTYNVETGEDWLHILAAICQRLEQQMVITAEEARKIVEREQSGNPLVVNNYSIPHCISNKENFVICVYIHLDQPVVIEQTDVNNVLVSLMNPMMNKNLNIFKFLYRYLHDHESELAEANSYDDFVKYINL